MRRLVLSTVCMIAILALLMAGARIVGNPKRTPESVLFDPGNCLQPCWHSIQLGKTTLDQAEAILRADPEFITDVQRETPVVRCALSWTMQSKPIYYGCLHSLNGVISELWLESWWIHDGRPLSDALIALGSPITVNLCRGMGYYGTMYVSRDIRLSLQFYSPLYMALPIPGDDSSVIVPFILYEQPDASAAHRPTGYRWRGFEEPFSGYAFPPPSKYDSGEC